MRSAHTPLSEPVFDEPIMENGVLTPDPGGFLVKHPSDSPIYDELGDAQNKDVVAVPKSRLKPDELFPLASAYGSGGDAVVKKITKAGRITFHSIGDSGASQAGKFRNELTVADQLTEECQSNDAAMQPAFLFHLGDVVYSFGEARYYYDQFYEPFRHYPRPIFAIPGNHDSFIVPGTDKKDLPLTTFQRNFCAAKPAITGEAKALHRTAMTQPGVYFTLDAPFVRIIALFTNALENPGVISAEGGKWPEVTDEQLLFLEAQLKRVKAESYPGAVLLAVHHPPFTYSPPKGEGGASGHHTGSTAMLREIDKVCTSAGVYPHAFLTAHAHNYQRYTRTITFNGGIQEVPFLVCGSGGHNVNALVRARKGEVSHEPHFGADVSYLDTKPVVKSKGLKLAKYDDGEYGYLRITVDPHVLRLGFHRAGKGSIAQSRFDLVTVDVKKKVLVAN